MKVAEPQDQLGPGVYGHPGLLVGFCRPVFVALILAVAVGVSPGSAADTQRGELSEYELKAAYLFNFARFVEWPPDAFSDQKDPVSIAVVGDDPFGPILDNGIEGKTVNNRRLVISRVKWPTDLRRFHIVFIGSSEERQLPAITGSLQDAPVLTVTESELVTRSRCVINLIMEGKKVRFEVDMNSAERAHLKISSKLLTLARVFKDGRLQGRE